NAGRLIKATDALGNTRSTRYTAFGQVKQSLAGGVVKAEYGYDRAGRVNREVDGESAVTTYIYNNQGQVQYQVRQHVSDAYQAFQSASGHLISRQVTQYHYDARGNVIERQTAQDYRSGTRISGGDTLTDVRGSSLRYQAQWTRKYDHQGRVVSEVDGAGREKVIDYLHGGRIKTVKLSGALQERIELDALGRTLSIANGVGATTRYEYDDTRNTVTVVSPGGIRTVTEKNAHGETVSITDGLGNRRLFHYNHNGQVVRTEFRAANSSTSEVLSSKEYDANTGLLRFETNAEGTRTEIRYNAIGKQWKVIRDANGEKLQTEYGYDSQGQRIWEDTEGQRTYVRYDNNGQKVRVEQGGIATTYQYDANGNVIRKVEGVVSGANVVREERVTEYNYDTNANLLAKRIKSGSDWTGTGSSHITRYSYDGAGN
ncbi:RHS repeat protein, partial [Vibrio vulnificus]|nr:RHS repeat protein [Vibrio vulnificus]